MFDPVLTANSVATSWLDLLGALPPVVKDRVALFEEADYAIPPAVNFALDGVTIANVHAKIDAHAQALAVAAQHDEARRQARTALAQAVIQAAADAVPEVIETLTPEFDTAVATYRAAVALLPEHFTADQLLGSPEIEAAHKTASEAAQRIKRIDTWLGRTADLPGYITTERSSVMRVVAATDRAELKALLDGKSKKFSPAELKVDPVYRAAADLGLTFRMAVQSEADQLRREIESRPLPRNAAQRFVTLR
jgi:hypothetical protein